jgi:hypothetical protein
MAIALCPVCQSQLEFEPWDGDLPSDEICPFCRIQFGYDDSRQDLRERIYSEWRDAWTANNRRPLTREQCREVGARVATLMSDPNKGT